MTKYIIGSLLGTFLVAACSGGEGSPLVEPTPKPTNPVVPTPNPTPAPKPIPRPYAGYEGYTLISDGGISHIPMKIPTGVLRLPRLWLMDREGTISRDLYQDLMKDDPELVNCCETKLSISDHYLALMAHFDFTGTGRRQASRLILIDRATLKLVKSISFVQPEAWSDERERASFTLGDGSTYIAFTNKHFYLLNPDTQQMTPLQGLPQGFVVGATSWNDAGYFIMQDNPNVYFFRKGQTRAEVIKVTTRGGLSLSGSSGAYCVFTNNDGLHYLFSLSEHKVLASFRTSTAIGRSVYYDAEHAMLYYTGSSTSDAISRSLYRIQLDLPNATSKSPSELYYRIAGRTESDSRQGYFSSLGARPEEGLLYLSWLDQGRTGPALENRTKMVALPIADTSATLPVKASRQYELRDTYDVRNIFLLDRLP